jgi:hypothetical protein
MIEPTTFIIFLIVSYALIKASYTDWKTRKVPVKTWYFAVSIALPISILYLGYKILNGWINVLDPMQAFGMAYPLFIILFIYLIASISEKYFPRIKIGGADFIAIAIILITSISIGLYLPILYIILFGIFSIITTVITYCLKNWKIFKIPLIVPISLAYFVAIPFYLTFGFLY